MNRKVKKFNIRVYGILLNEKMQVLLSHEHKGDLHFTKFPGGGLEFGEGTIDGLRREFLEEAGIEVKVERHLYTTDFFQRSAFNEEHQLISIYYLVSSSAAGEVINGQKVKDAEADSRDHFRWIDLDSMVEADVTYPIDKKMVALIKRSLLQP